MRKMRIKQRIIAITLSFAMLFSIIHIENFLDNKISATDNTELTNEEKSDTALTLEEIEQEILNRVEESNDIEDLVVLNFTWKETTAKRNLYDSYFKEQNIGKKWFNETIEEIIQMSKDPSIEFDEENFFYGTCFEGLIVEDLLWLQEEGYTLMELVNEISNSEKIHIFEYLYGMQMFSAFTEEEKYAIVATFSKKRTNLAKIIPSLGRGWDYNPRTFYKMTLNGRAAFCMDPELDMWYGEIFEWDDSIITETEMEIVRKALYWFVTKTEGLDTSSDEFEEYYALTQIYIWCMIECHELSIHCDTSLKCPDCTQTFSEIYNSTYPASERSDDEYIMYYVINTSKTDSQAYCEEHALAYSQAHGEGDIMGRPIPYIENYKCHSCANYIKAGDAYLPRVSWDYTTNIAHPNVNRGHFREYIVCKDCATDGASLGYNSVLMLEYYACDYIEKGMQVYLEHGGVDKGTDISAYTQLEIMKIAGTCYDVYSWNTATDVYREIANIEVDPDFVTYAFDYKKLPNTLQRLITTAPPEELIPDPDTESVFPEVNFYESKMYVIHNINGVIDQSTGKGIIASWNKGDVASNNPYNWRTDATTKQSYCGTDYSAKIYSFPYEYNQEDYNSKGDAVIKEEIKEKLRDSLMQADYKVSISGPEISTYETGDKLGTTYTHYTYTATVQMFDTEAHNQGATHIIYKPLVRNYKMTINYQGGWVDDLSTTTELGTFNNNANSFDATHDGNRTSNKTSTQTTNVKFAKAEVKAGYKFNTAIAANPYKKGTLTVKSSDENGATSWTYTHAKNIGVTEMIEFTYNGYYAVYLPTPERTGYNFLYYTDAKGNVVTPTTLNINGVDYSVYIFDDTKCSSHYTKINDTLYSYELFANWELITKDETVTVYWLDNSNNYTTRPESVYVELWRYTEDGYAELCDRYITEDINSSSNDWIVRFSNETGMASDGNSEGGIKTTGIFDPNEYLNTTGTKNTVNNIFEAKDSYYIKISGDNNNPANTNSWTVTLKNLQKYDTYSEDWQEYTYVAREVICESLDTTTQYYINPENNNKYYKDYSASLENFYSLAYESYSTNSGQKTRYDYDDLDMKENFSLVITNRLANKVLGINNWKDVTVNITFEDGPQNEVITGKNTYDDDIYHFRPYSVTVDLYQNYAYGIDKTSNNFLSEEGVRVLYKSVPVKHESGNAWSSTNNIGIVQGTVAEKLANMLRVTFKNVPTVQDEACIKIAYDAIVTHGNTKYRYTINSSDENNNLGDKYESNSFYANKHEEITTTITDLDYDIMYKGSSNVTVIPTVWKEITLAQYNALDALTKEYFCATDKTDLSRIRYFTADMTKKSSGQIFMCEVGYYQSLGYKFPVDNENNVYQEYPEELKKYETTDELVLLGQNNIYQTLGLAVGTKKYPDAYKSMAYNIRYYKITEDRNMDADPTYNDGDDGIPFEKRYESIDYKENLVWNFVLTLNHADTKLPTEYSGSSSEDDRTGNYNGEGNDDFTFTNNVITITNNVYSDDKYTVTAVDSDYDKLIMNIEHEDFLITFKQVQKIWNNQGHDVTESYNNDKYSINGYMYVNNGTSMKVSYKSNTDVIDGAIGIGNDYNVLVPANGSVTLDYLPDGKYEITCHYDIDFDSFDFSFEGTTGTAKFTEENGKHYVTLSSKDVYTEGTVNHVATIDYWRGYVNDQNNNNSATDNIFEDYIVYKSSLR